EISYESVKAAGARVVATSLSHEPNQLNSSLVCPGVFRGALDVRATDISHAMLVAASHAMAGLVTQDGLDKDIIFAEPFDYRVSAKIAHAVAKAALDTGVAQVKVDPKAIEDKVMSFVYEGSNAWVEEIEDGELAGKSVDEISLINHKRYHGVIEAVSYV